MKKVYDVAKVCFFLLSIILMYYLLNHIGFANIRDSFIKIGFLGAAVLVFMGFAENVLDSASLKYASPKDIPLYKIHAINSVGGIMNSVFPWEAGEFVKSILIKKDATLNEAVMGVVIYNFIFKISKPVVIFLTIILALFLRVRSDSTYIVLIFFASMISFAPYVAISLLIKFSAATKFFKFAGKITKRDFSVFIDKVDQFESAVSKFRQRQGKSFFLIFFLQFCARVISLITFLFAAWLIGDVTDTFAILILSHAAINLANYVAMLVPAKLGVAEGTSYFIFSMLGLDGGFGIMIVLILRIKALFTQGVSCLLLLFI